MNPYIRQQIYFHLFYKAALARHYLQHHVIDENSESELERYDQVLNPYILRHIRFKAKLLYYLCLPVYYLLYHIGKFDPDSVPIDENAPPFLNPYLDPAWRDFIDTLNLDNLGESPLELNPFDDFYNSDDFSNPDYYLPFPPVL